MAGPGSFAMSGANEALKKAIDMGNRAERALDLAIHQEAQLFRSQVIRAFVAQGAGGKRWDPLNIITIELRRNMGQVGGRTFKGTKALMASGLLRGSVQVHKIKDAKYFVGVHKRSKAGVRLAGIHEFGGAVIPITDRMRRYFMYLYIKGVLTKFWPPPNKKFIIIKQRSFLQDTFDDFKKGFEFRVQKRIKTFVIDGKAQVG